MPAGLCAVLKVWLIGAKAIWHCPLGYFFFFSAIHSACVLNMLEVRYMWFYEMCGNVKYTVAPLSLLFEDSQHGGTAMVEHNQLLLLHSTHIFSKHKGLSVSLISITKSPWSVLQAFSPRSCASLETPTPPNSTKPPTPSCPRWAAKRLWCSYRIHWVQV